MEDILVFVEDTGAAQMVLGLPQARILATGNALNALQYHGVPHQALAPSAQASEILQRYQPRLLAVGTGENRKSFGFDLIAAAKAEKIKTVGLVDATVNAQHRFQGVTQDPLAYMPDFLVVPDSATRDIYVSLGVPNGRINIVGYVQIDMVHQASEELRKKGQAAVRGQLFPKAGTRPILVFIAETLGGIEPPEYQQSAEYKLRGRGKAHDRTRIVLEELLDALAEIKPRPYVVLRLHPKNTPEEFATYVGEVDIISKKEPALAIVFASDFIVGMTSTLMFEAAILSRPTLSIVPRTKESTWLPSVVAGVTPQATTKKQIKSALAHLLKPDQKEKSTFSPWPAGARDRLVKVLEQIL